MPIPLALCLLAIGLLLAVRPGFARLAGIVLAGIGFTALHATSVLQAQLPRTLERRPLIVEGRIVDLPLHEARRTRFEFQVDAATGHPSRCAGDACAGLVRRRSGGAPPLVAGSRWRLPVQLRPPQALRNPGAGDGEKYALASRLVATGYVLEPALAQRLAPPDGIAGWRTHERAHRCGDPSRQRTLHPGAGAGRYRGLDDTDWARLRAGLTHLIAISGFHVGLVAGFFALVMAGIWWCLPRLAWWLPRPFAAGLVRCWVPSRMRRSPASHCRHCVRR